MSYIRERERDEGVSRWWFTLPGNYVRQYFLLGPWVFHHSSDGTACVAEGHILQRVHQHKTKQITGFSCQFSLARISLGSLTSFFFIFVIYYLSIYLFFISLTRLLYCECEDSQENITNQPPLWLLETLVAVKASGWIARGVVMHWTPCLWGLMSWSWGKVRREESPKEDGKL